MIFETRSWVPHWIMHREDINILQHQFQNNYL